MFLNKTSNIKPRKAYQTLGVEGKKLPDGSIVIAAVKDEGIEELKPEQKQWFTDMGSKEIEKIGYRESYIFIGISGKK